MVQAVLIEDDDATRDYLEHALVEEFARRNERLWVATYADGPSFLRTLGDSYHVDVLFLDIEMPGMDGLTLAKRIRTIMPHVLLVFVSGREQWVFRTFEVQPFRFVRKQTFRSELPDLVSALISALASTRQRVIYLTEPGTEDIFSFDVSALHYVEARRKECRVVADSGETMLRCPLKVLREQLEPWDFIQCHRSYLVNWRSIYRVGKTEIVLANGEMIPVSRGLRDQVRQEFMRVVEREGG